MEITRRRSKNNISSKFKNYLKLIKINKMKKDFIKEIESIFHYNSEILKMDTFYSCHKEDRKLEVPILNIRELIKEKEYDKYFKYRNIKCKKSMKYSNYLKGKRELDNGSYESDVEKLYDEVKWLLLTSAKYKEKKIDTKFSIIIKK